MKLVVKNGIDLKDFETYGFEKLENDYSGHKYSWRQNKLGWFYEIYINSKNEIHIQIQSEDSFRQCVLASKLQCKLYQLIIDDLVEVVEE